MFCSYRMVLRFFLVCRYVSYCNHGIVTGYLYYLFLSIIYSVCGIICYSIGYAFVFFYLWFFSLFGYQVYYWLSYAHLYSTCFFYVLSYVYHLQSLVIHHSVFFLVLSYFGMTVCIILFI